MTFTSQKYLFYLALIFLGAASLSACSQEKQSNAQPELSTNTETISVTMYKNPNCECCSKWAAYLEENGFSVTSIPSENLAAIKYDNGVPNNLGACHTALIDGYVVEGHVPVEAINKLLQERPEATGIAVPGMPAGSPGMAEEPTPVDVYFFNGSDQVAYFDTF